MPLSWGCFDNSFTHLLFAVSIAVSNDAILRASVCILIELRYVPRTATRRWRIAVFDACRMAYPLLRIEIDKW